MSEVAKNEREGLLLADRRKRAGRQTFAFSAVLAGHVAEGHLGVGRLLRFEHRREPVDALVGYAHGPESHLAAVADGCVETGHGVEHGGLA